MAGELKELSSYSQSNNANWEEAFDLQGLEPSDFLRARAYMQVRPLAGGPGVVLDLSSPRDGLKLDPDSSTLKVKVHYRSMQLIPAGDYKRDILIVKNDREVIFCGAGAVEIVQGVTQLKDNSPWHLR